MKPNDKAIEAAFLEAKILLPEEDLREYVQRVLTEAFRAQFPPSEDYAGLVEELRSSAILGRRFLKEHNGWIDQYEKAADAIETLLAKLNSKPKPSEDYVGLVKELKHSANFAKREDGITLCKAADALETLLALLENWKTGCYFAANERDQAQEYADKVGEENDALKAERDALLARLAPVDDYNLEIMAAKEWIEATTDMPPRTTYTISKRSLSGARNAIAAIRPHIEAAVVEKFSEPSPEMIAAAWAVFRRDNHKSIGPGPGFVEAMKAMAAAAIRSGK